MGWLENLYNGALKLANVVNEKTEQLEEYKNEFIHLNDRELFNALKKETVGLKKSAIKMLLKERGYEYDYDKMKWCKQ